MNADKNAAQEWYDRTRAIAEGDNKPDAAEPTVVLASEEDAAAYLRSIGR